MLLVLCWSKIWTVNCRTPPTGEFPQRTSYIFHPSCRNTKGTYKKKKKKPVSLSGLNNRRSSKTESCGENCSFVAAQSYPTQKHEEKKKNLCFTLPVSVTPSSRRDFSQPRVWVWIQPIGWRLPAAADCFLLFQSVGVSSHTGVSVFSRQHTEYTPCPPQASFGRQWGNTCVGCLRIK